MKKGLHKLKNNFYVRAKDASESFGLSDLHFSGKRAIFEAEHSRKVSFAYRDPNSSSFSQR